MPTKWTTACSWTTDRVKVIVRTRTASCAIRGVWFGKAHTQPDGVEDTGGFVSERTR